MQSSQLALLDAGDTVRSCSARLTAILDRANAQTAHIADAAGYLTSVVDVAQFGEYSDLLTRSCARLFDLGESAVGIALAKKVATRAEEVGDIRAQRRVTNIIGAQYCDIADYASSMSHLETAIKLARQLESPLQEAACLANVVAVLQEMGHYREAIAMADRVALIADASPIARTLKIQCASVGLFAAHRVRDFDAAGRFLALGERYVDETTEPLRRAFFEKNRVLFLVDHGRTDEATRHLQKTLKALETCQTLKTRFLTTIATAVCEWGVGDVSKARADLTQLYLESRRSKFYHHFVLQALVKVFENSNSPEDAAKGMSYAHELVEYTTSVKKAKFYRQLATKREISDEQQFAVPSITSIDPFGTVREWLSTSDIRVPPEEGTERRQLAKHEELTAIHEDMAKLRALSIRRDIRTDAVDTAENWAIAAEFFDDETGQHCYRVGHLASMLAREIDMDETFCIQVEHAARLHDIGKIAVNEVILLKPGPLDAAEMAAMRLHTEVGAQILAGSDDPTLRMATDIARHHHEWWNGGGYPARLAGRHIPLSARICAFADVYDALTHMRAYKKAWTHERAVAEIERLSGIQFDPGLLPAFMHVLTRYRGDLENNAIPGFADMDANALLNSRKKLLETIAGEPK